MATLILLTGFFSSTVLASADKPPVSLHKIPVILDTDMGMDDWLAVLYLLNRPDVDILAITIPVTGQASCQAGINNVNKLIDLSGKFEHQTIPVACGHHYVRDKYIVSFPEKWRNEAQELGGIALPFSTRPLLNLSAERVIQEIVNKQAKLGVKPIIMTLGPLTTVANMVEQDPDFKDKIAYVISMGGAVSVKGNIQEADPVLYQNKVSEWNFYADPLAAKRVIESGLTFKIIPLDATDTVPLNQDFMRNLKKIKKSKSAEFVYQALSQRHKIKNDTGYCFWDSLTVAMVFDETLGSFKKLPIQVNIGEPHISGQTVVDHQYGRYIQVALSANPKRFHQDFLTVINY